MKPEAGDGMSSIESTIVGLFQLGYGLCVAVYITFRHPLRGPRLLRFRHRRRKAFSLSPYTYCYASLVGFFFVFYRTLLDPEAIKTDILNLSPGKFIIFLLLASAAAMAVFDISSRLAVALKHSASPTLRKLTIERAVFSIPFATLSFCLLGVAFDLLPLENLRKTLPLSEQWPGAILLATTVLLAGAAVLSPFYFPWSAAIFAVQRSSPAGTTLSASWFRSQWSKRFLASLTFSTVFILSVFGIASLGVWLSPVPEAKLSAFYCDISDGTHLRVYMVVTLPPSEGQGGGAKSGPYFLPKRGFKASLFAPDSATSARGLSADLELVASSQGKDDDVTVLLPNTTSYLIFQSGNLLAVDDFLNEHGHIASDKYYCTIEPPRRAAATLTFGPWFMQRGRVIAPEFDPSAKLREMFSQLPPEAKAGIVEETLKAAEAYREKIRVSLKRMEERLETAKKDGSDLSVLSEQFKQASHRMAKLEAEIASGKAQLALLRSSGR